jgi:heme-degrading monooxygenase HmoA
MRTNKSSSVDPPLPAIHNPRRNCMKTLGLVIAAAVAGKNSLPESLAQDSGSKAEAPKSVQLHIYIEVKLGKGPELEKLYHSAYVPAIRVQNGFLWSRLLRHYDSSNKYEIDISFSTEKQRATWAQSKEHQAAWPKIEEVSAKITWQGFDQLA